MTFEKAFSQTTIFSISDFDSNDIYVFFPRVLINNNPALVVDVGDVVAG